jgi:cytochrome b561
VAAVHAAAALKHHFYDRDDVLRRMLPGKRGLTRTP